MIELRWLVVRYKPTILQFRQMVNVLELGIQEPIWSEWEDVPNVYQIINR